MLYYSAKPNARDVYQILRFFLCILASVDDAAAVNRKGIKKNLANGLITFFIKGNPAFNNGPKSPPRNPPVYQLIIIYEENLSRHQQLYLMIMSKLLLFHILLQTLIY